MARALSRQRVWQIKQQEAGRCVKCGKPREEEGQGNGQFCEHHRLEHLKTMKKQYRKKVKNRLH